MKFYRSIIFKGFALLKESGLLALEIADGQMYDVKNLFDDAGMYSSVNFYKDCAGIYRVAIASKKG